MKEVKQGTICVLIFMIVTIALQVYGSTQGTKINEYIISSWFSMLITIMLTFATAAEYIDYRIKKKKL